MTTYSIQAIHAVDTLEGSEPIGRSVRTVQALLTVEDGATAINYRVGSDNVTGSSIGWPASTYFALKVDGSESVTREDTLLNLIFSGTRDGASNTLALISAEVEGEDAFQTFYLNLGGPVFEDVSTQDELPPFIDSFTNRTSNLSPDPGPGNSITLGTPSIAFATENDVFVFDDTVQWHNVGLGNDSIDGGGGTDMLSFVNMTGGMTIDMGEGTATGGGVAHSFQNFEGVTGSIFGDYITGDDSDNRIRALGDYDWLMASKGDDTYEGGTGRDMVSYIENDGHVSVNLAGSANKFTLNEFGVDEDRLISIERVTGSSYNDRFQGSDEEVEDFRGMGGYDEFKGSGGRDRYDGGSGLDTVEYGSSSVGVVASLLLGRGSAGDARRDLYTSIENLEGSRHDDVLTGDHGRNRLDGGLGNDTLIGNGDVDRLVGFAGDDVMDGGTGWDYALYALIDQSEFTWETVDGVTTVTHSNKTPFTIVDHGTDTLTNIEVLSFADGDVIL